MTSIDVCSSRIIDAASLEDRAVCAGNTVSNLAITYWRMREQQERVAADVAQCASLRSGHAAMAKRYAQFAERIEKFATIEDRVAGVAYV